ncbi:N-acetylmuramidase domain-containing protein [Psychrobacter sp. HD31]
MRQHNWKVIAKTWNGSKYWVHGYHNKLKHAYL